MIYEVECIRKETYKLRVDANSKSEAIKKTEDFITDGVDWMPNPDLEFKVKPDKDQVIDNFTLI